MNTTIYANTLAKILKHKFTMTFIILLVFGIPLSQISPGSSELQNNAAHDPYLLILLMGMMVTTLSCPFPLTLNMSRRMDCMPLLVTRPIPRWQYITAKWLAMSTVLCGASILQQVFNVLIGHFGTLEMTPLMILCSFIDRLMIGMGVSAVMTMVYMLPSEMAVLTGVLAMQIAAANHLFSASISVVSFEAVDKLRVMIWDIFGVSDFVNSKLLPLLLGATSQERLQNYVGFFNEFSLFMAPNINTYDLLRAEPICLAPLLQITSNIALCLFLATVVLNVREFHYDSD